MIEAGKAMMAGGAILIALILFDMLFYFTNGWIATLFVGMVAGIAGFGLWAFAGHQYRDD